MKLLQKLLAILILLIISIGSYAQANWDQIYTDMVETVQLHPPGDILGDPFIVLGDNNSKLVLSFDGFGAEFFQMEYKLIHCDADWEESDLLHNEYIEGFEEAFIDNFEFSINTKQPYIHYRQLIPHNNMRIYRSGNYVLKVYPEDQEDKPIFIKRLMVIDPIASIVGMIRRPSDPSIRQTHQEVDFEVDISNVGSTFPSNEIRVFVRQNGRWDNMIKDIKPLSIMNGVMDYNWHNGSNIFPGINTFRYFDFTSQRYNSEYVERIDVSGEIDKIFLLPDEIRRDQEYIAEPDFHGAYFIESKDWTNSRVEAEYSDVFFSLRYPAPLTDGEVYVVGELTNWNITPYNKMTYNFETKSYETILYLKQGYYSYVYAFLPNNATTADISFFEGNNYETQNYYYVFVYYRAPGTVLDQLVGVQVFKDYQI
jgi:hypothetical protein